MLLHLVGLIPDLVKGAIDDETKREIEERTPQNRLGKPEEIADVVAFLSSPAASHVTGTVLLIDGGYSIFIF